MTGYRWAHRAGWIGVTRHVLASLVTTDEPSLSARANRLLVDAPSLLRVLPCELESR